MSDTGHWRSFAEFYPYYLREHANRISRRLHFTGTSIAIMLLLGALAGRSWWLAGVAVLQGYAWAWIGHFFFEHNRPATFRHPWYSLMGDFRLWWEIVSGRIRP